MADYEYVHASDNDSSCSFDLQRNNLDEMHSGKKLKRNKSFYVKCIMLINNSKASSLVTFFSATILFARASALVPPSLEAGWAAYRAALVSKPLLTKAVTSGVIMGFSDVFTQSLERTFLANKDETDADTTAKSQNTVQEQTKEKAAVRTNWMRTWHIVCTGMFWSGPSAHCWYSSLERIMQHIVVPVVGSNRLVGLVSRLLLDSIIFSPITIAGFFTINSLIQAGPSRTNLLNVVSVIQEKLSTKWSKAVLAAWSFWPVVNVVNFSVVPLKYRVLYANVMALLWTGYLSFVNHQKKKKEE